LNPTTASSRTLTTSAEPTSTTAAVSSEAQNAITKPIDIYHVPRQPYHLSTGIVLSRPPLITRDLPAFEQAFYVYQRRLDQRLALPFTSAFYFKKKTVAEEEYKAKKKIREQKPWFYNPYDRHNGFKDEIVAGQMGKQGLWFGAGAKELGYQEFVETTPSGEEKIMEESASALGIAAGKTAPERPYPRETEADRTNDFTKLDRKLSRTLYLVVKGQDEGFAGGKNGWRFPMARLQGDESLRQV
jgi:large subunit ribosomal protein L46